MLYDFLIKNRDEILKKRAEDKAPLKGKIPKPIVTSCKAELQSVEPARVQRKEEAEKPPMRSTFGSYALERP